MFNLFAAAALSLASCSYVGDSNAVGLQQVDPTCAINRTPRDETEYTVVSIDPRAPNTYAAAASVRRSIRSRVIVWILPYDRKAAADIKKFAFNMQDDYIDLYKYPSRDQAHPANYRRVSREIKQAVFDFYD